MTYDLCDMLRTTWTFWFATILVIALQVSIILPRIKNIFYNRVTDVY